MFDLMDFNSFYSIWYWMLTSLIWAWVCYQTLGMSYGMILRAERRPAAQIELETIAHIQAHRLKWVRNNLGVPLAAIAGFGLSLVGVLAFWNRIEFFQALFMLAFPLALVATATLRLSGYLVEVDPKGADLRAVLSRRRRWNQLIAIAAMLAAGFIALFYDPRSLLY